jgi:transposase
VSIDYHVDLEHHYYSVPHQLDGKEVEVRYTATTVEILCQGKRVASHTRSNRPGKHTTIGEHRPKAHQKYLEWTPSRIVEWAATIGPFTAQLAGRIMAERPHPEQGYRSCMGLIGLGRRYGNDRLESAAKRAIDLQAHSYPSVKSILERGLDRQSTAEPTALALPVEHANIRGASYYADSLFEEVAQ